MEEQLRREAAVKGIEAHDLARDIIARHQQRTPRWALLTVEEEEQIRSLNSQLPSSYWERFNFLQQRHHTLSAAEQNEYLQLWLQAEEWNVRRLELLEGMARTRKRSLPALIKALRIKHHPSARQDDTGA